MTSAAASKKKRGGHQLEQIFARLIGGCSRGGKSGGKADVVASDGTTTFSVKSGKWWQVFLYGLSRFQENTGFRDIRGIAQAFINCLLVFPDEGREAYEADKQRYKENLREPMRKLKDLLSSKETLRQFLTKAFLDGDRVEFMVIENTRGKTPRFHIFEGKEFVDILTREFHVENSRARQEGQFSEQKVLLRYRPNCSKPKLINVGEIEPRNESPEHYREMKFRVNGCLVMHILTRNLGDPVCLGSGLLAYGRAAQDLAVKANEAPPKA